MEVIFLTIETLNFDRSCSFVTEFFAVTKVFVRQYVCLRYIFISGDEFRCNKPVLPQIPPETTSAEYFLLAFVIINIYDLFDKHFTYFCQNGFVSS